MYNYQYLKKNLDYRLDLGLESFVKKSNCIHFYIYYNIIKVWKFDFYWFDGKYIKIEGV